MMKINMIQDDEKDDIKIDYIETTDTIDEKKPNIL